MEVKTDRELLELAAKAAGIELAWSSNDDQSPRNRANWNVWNPLFDDGDALRLAVRLRLDINHHVPQHGLRYVAVIDWDGCETLLECPSDHDACTRRAIVLAAAELARKGSE
jgi:hypothetical protein